MAGATIAPALPAMATYFEMQAAANGPTEDTGLLVRLALTGPGLFTAIVSLFAGNLVDRFGRFGPLALGLVLYVVAGTSGLYVQSIWQLLIGRAFLGAAVALVMVATSALIADLFAGPARQRFTGLQGACMSFGGVGFLVTAGFLADVSWRTPFYIYFAALVVLIGVLASVPRGRAHLRGAGVGQGGSTSNEHATVNSPAVNLRLICFVLGVGFVGMVLFYMIPTHLPFRLVEIGVLERRWGGIAIAVNGLVAGLVAMQYFRVRARLAFASITGVQMLLMAVGYGTIALATNYAMTLLGCALTGLGQGLMLPNAMTWMQSIAPPALRGRLTGYLVSAIFFGQFLSPLITKPLGDRVGIAAEFGIAALLMVVLGAGMLVGGRRGGVRPGLV